MTVIAWDGINLAWDSRVTTGDRKHIAKKARALRDGRVVVVAGLLSHVDVVKRLLDGNGYPTLPNNIVEYSDVVVYDRGKVFAYDSTEVARKVTTRAAWGSGGDLAMGALECGVSAHEACRVACKHSATCGGKIHST